MGFYTAMIKGNHIQKDSITEQLEIYDTNKAAENANKTFNNELVDVFVTRRTLHRGIIVIDGASFQVDKEVELLLASLTEDVTFLRALEAAGVDNWSGYEEAQEMVE